MATASLRRLGAYELGDEHQDLCQEVVWALVRAVKAGRAPSDDKVPAYVAAVVRNLFVTWLRKRESAPALASSDRSADTIAAASDGVASPPCDVQSDGRLAARRALARLPREWQSLLVAHYVEGSTLEMLASASGTPRATLNREIRRARDAFRAALLDGVDPGEARMSAGLSRSGALVSAVDEDERR
jgi:RNA polymerase sigma factor (sigma-70 family)